MIECHLEDAGFPTGGEDRRGLLDPLPLDIGEERLAGEREEDPVKMERGEGGHPGQPGEGQGLVQPPTDVVDDAIDALFVFRPGGVRPWAVPAQSPPPSPQPRRPRLKASTLVARGPCNSTYDSGALRGQGADDSGIGLSRMGVSMPCLLCRFDYRRQKWRWKRAPM
jgi:hypothetical protein